jgi:DNA-binding MarR family transcriptional regulator
MQYTSLMNPNSHQDTVYWLLMQVMFQAKHSLSDIADKYGISTMQLNTLMMLRENEPLAMNILSNHFMCDASNVTGIADRLESQGFVARQNHPTDRRSKLIAITENGLELREKILSETVTAQTARLNPVLDESERAILRVLLEKILNAQNQHPIL